MGRKPVAANALNNDKHHKSHESLHARRHVEETLIGDGIIRCPSYLSSEVKKEFKRIVKHYAAIPAKILSALDLNNLVSYCEAVVIYRILSKQWEEEPVAYLERESSKGICTIAPNPLLKQINDQNRIIISLGEQLCLSPVGRARMGMLGMKKIEEESPLDSIFD